MLLRKYQKAFKFLFNKYANSGYNPNTRSSIAESVFEHMMERTEYMNQAECNRFIKDYGITAFMTKEDNQNLLRNFSVRILKRRDSTDLDFYAFEKYLIQLALFTTTCPARNFASLSPGEQMELFIRGVRDAMAARKESTVLFDSPDTAYFKESDLIEEFNRRLEQDAEFALPEGYRKVFEKEVRMDFALGAPIDESYTHSIEILDELIQQVLQVRIIEPRISKRTVVKAKPSGMAKNASKLMEKSTVKAEKKPYSVEKKRRIIDAHENVNLTLGMKLGISYLGPKQKQLGLEIAYVLEQVIKAVEMGRSEPIAKVENYA